MPQHPCGLWPPGQFPSMPSRKWLEIRQVCWPPPPCARANTGHCHFPGNNGILWWPQSSLPVVGPRAQTLGRHPLGARAFTGAWRPAELPLRPEQEAEGRADPLRPARRPTGRSPQAPPLAHIRAAPRASAGANTSTPRGQHPPAAPLRRWTGVRESPHHEGRAEWQGFRAPRPGGCLWPKRPLRPDGKDGENHCPQPYSAEISR